MGIFKEREEWVRPVYFLKTPSNNINHRFHVPAQSNASLLLSVDDDIKMNCEEMRTGWRLYRRGVVAEGVGPIVSYHPRTLQFIDGSFRYTYDNKQYFNMALVGTAFFSRHLLDLYYLNRPEFNRIRSYVEVVNNCEDIFMNFMVAYLYP